MRLLLLNLNYLRYHFFIKPCRTSQTSKTPPSRRTSNHKHRANCSKLRVIAKMTNDKWPLNVLIINDFVVIWSFEIFLNSELTSVNVDIRGKKLVFQQAIFPLLKSEECIARFFRLKQILSTASLWAARTKWKHYD